MLRDFWITFQRFSIGLCAAVGALVVVAVSVLALLGVLTTYEDGSAIVGDPRGVYVAWCAPWGTCTK